MPRKPWHHQASRHERGYGSEWYRLRSVIMARDLYLCQPCKKAGIITPAKECDHIIPKAKGGTDDPANLQAICIPCHNAKTQDEAKAAQGSTYRIIGIDGWPLP